MSEGGHRRSLDLDRAVGALPSACASRPACPWTGPFRALHEHKGACPLAVLPCPNAALGCPALVPRAQREAHDRACEHKVVQCAFCPAVCTQRRWLPSHQMQSSDCMAFTQQLELASFDAPAVDALKRVFVAGTEAFSLDLGPEGFARATEHVLPHAARAPYFRAFTRGSAHPRMMFHQLLRGVAAMFAPHNGAWGRLRLVYIFHLYDLDGDGVLGPAELASLLADLGAPPMPAGATMSLDDLVLAVEHKRVRGTSGLLRPYDNLSLGQFLARAGSPAASGLAALAGADPDRPPPSPASSCFSAPDDEPAAAEAQLQPHEQHDPSSVDVAMGGHPAAAAAAANDTSTTASDGPPRLIRRLSMDSLPVVHASRAGSDDDEDGGAGGFAISAALPAEDAFVRTHGTGLDHLPGIRIHRHAVSEPEAMPVQVARYIAHQLAHDGIVEEAVNPHSGFVDRFTLLQPQDLVELCNYVCELLLSQPTLVRVDAPAKVFGDIHAQLRDLLDIFSVYGSPNHYNGDIDLTSYVFNGDFVDRGRYGMEICAILFSLKALYPRRVYLIRGNHEDAQINAKYGFRLECTRRCGEADGVAVWEAINAAFNALPLAAMVEDQVFVVHGGIGKTVQTLEQVEAIQRPIPCPLKEQITRDLLWSDPNRHDEVLGQHALPGRGEKIFSFGRDDVLEFCRRNQVSLIVRSHQCVSAGYEFFADGHLLTLFSAKNYHGNTNDAALLQIVPDRSHALLQPDEDAVTTGDDVVPEEGMPAAGAGAAGVAAAAAAAAAAASSSPAAAASSRPGSRRPSFAGSSTGEPHRPGPIPLKIKVKVLTRRGRY